MCRVSMPNAAAPAPAPPVTSMSDADWVDAVGPAEPMEQDMLDFASDVRATSRLCCQIRIKPELDGLKVITPARQG